MTYGTVRPMKKIWRQRNTEWKSLARHHHPQSQSQATNKMHTVHTSTHIHTYGASIRCWNWMRLHAKPLCCRSFICQSRIMKLIVHALIFWSIFQICYCLLSCVIFFAVAAAVAVASLFVFHCAHTICSRFDSFWLLLLESPHSHAYTSTQ